MEVDQKPKRKQHLSGLDAVEFARAYRAAVRNGLTIDEMAQKYNITCGAIRSRLCTYARKHNLDLVARFGQLQDSPRSRELDWGKIATEIDALG